MSSNFSKNFPKDTDFRMIQQKQFDITQAKINQ